MKKNNLKSVWHDVDDIDVAVIHFLFVCLFVRELCFLFSVSRTEYDTILI